MPVFDLHCHPSLKSFLSHTDQSERTDCWTNINIGVDLNIFDSQSSLTQLMNGKVKLAVLPLYGLEKALAASNKIKVLARTSPKLDITFLRNVEKGTAGYGYNELIHKELAHLNTSIAKGKVKVISSINDFNENDGYLHIVLAVEGGHNFYGNHQEDNEDHPVNINDIFTNLSHFKNGNSRLLYITMTHLSHNILCTHAYGMKMIKDSRFCPKGKGITATGKKFIREALQVHNGKRILIDVKHMSLQARLEFYKLRKNEFPDAPIMASHMGVTGVSYFKMPVVDYYPSRKYVNVTEVKYQAPTGYAGTQFNPWSINLYDEEIIEIAKSGGIIGLSMDQRILGFGSVKTELFSEEEFDLKYKDKNLKRNQHTPHFDMEDDIYVSPESRKDLHLKYLCNNLLHAVQVGRADPGIGEAIWDHIAIGSDYDGLIDPIDYCVTAEFYQDLRKGLPKILSAMATANGIAITDVKTKVHKILYLNSFDFLKNHFN